MKKISNALLATHILAATTMKATLETQVSLQPPDNSLLPVRTGSTSFFVGIKMPAKQWKKQKSKRKLSKTSRKANRK